MITKIKEIISGLNVLEKERLLKDGLSRLYDEFDTNETLQYHLKEGGKKYLKINCGSSGVFMVEILTGEIFNIKAYGVPDKNKKLKSNLGNIKDYFCISSHNLISITKLRDLHAKRHNYLRGGWC